MLWRRSLLFVSHIMKAEFLYFCNMAYLKGYVVKYWKIISLSIVTLLTLSNCGGGSTTNPSTDTNGTNNTPPIVTPPVTPPTDTNETNTTPPIVTPPTDTNETNETNNTTPPVTPNQAPTARIIGLHEVVVWASITLDSNSTDPEGEPLSLEWRDGEGDIIGTASTHHYTGTMVWDENITLVVYDGVNHSTPATHTITTTEVLNTAPTAIDWIVQWNSSSSKTFSMADFISDEDKDSDLKIIITKAPLGGTLVMTWIDWIYTMSSWNAWDDSFEYQVEDSKWLKSEVKNIDLIDFDNF